MNHLILFGGHYSLAPPLWIHPCIYLCKHIKQSCFYAVSVSVVTLWHCIPEIHLNFLTPFPLWCNSIADTCTYVCFFCQQPPLPRLVCQNTLVTRHWELPPYHENWFTVWLLMCTIWWFFIYHTFPNKHMWCEPNFTLRYYITWYFKQILMHKVFHSNGESFTLCDIFSPCNFMLKN